MKRAACDDEKICFVFDESNILSSSFLERMNALLASGEVPGLFEGEELNLLINTMRESLQRRQEDSSGKLTFNLHVKLRVG